MELQNEVERQRGRLRQVFTYLKALDEHRNPAPRQIADQPWRYRLDDLPDHPAIRFEYPLQTLTEEEESGAPAEADELPGPMILRIRRPNLKAAPEPPSRHAYWIEGDWRSPFEDLRLHSQRLEKDEDEKTVVVRLGDDQQREQTLRQWLGRWKDWSRQERPARQAMGVFEELYALHGTINREGEGVELVFGDGVLRWRLPEGGIHHPILLQRCELHFDPKIPEFVVTEADAVVELYTAMLRSLPDLDGAALAKLREELTEGAYHPQHGEHTDAFLRSLVVRLSPQGEFLKTNPPSIEQDHPILGRQPWLFLRRRSLGFARAIEEILRDLEEREEFSTPLGRLVGFESYAGQDDSVSKGESSRPPAEPAEILLSRPANPEQIRTAELIEGQKSVVVQGPPGTGKTHTISNLIGHLLAQGKSVLVTSHTAKALRVLREQVVEELRPLCLSVLGNDQESREQLKNSVEEIVEHLSTVNPDQFERDARLRQERREQLLREIAELRDRLVESISGEYRDIVVAGRTWNPAQAARVVARDRATHSWIPGAVAAGEPPPLSADELEELYSSNGQIAVEDERLLIQGIPRADSVPSPDAVREVAEQKNHLDAVDTEYRADLWIRPVMEEDREVLEEFRGAVVAAEERLTSLATWEERLLEVGLSDQEDSTPWDDLLQAIRSVATAEAEFEAARFELAPNLPEGNREEQSAILKEIQEYLSSGRKLGRVAFWLHRPWKELVEGSFVRSKQPRNASDFEVLDRLAELEDKREQLFERWDRQAAAIGLPEIASLGDRPARKLVELGREVGRALRWNVEVWAPLRKKLEGVAFSWTLFESDGEAVLTSTPELDRLRTQLLAELRETVTARARAAKATFLERVHLELGQAVERLKQSGQPRLSRRLVEAIEQLDPDEYAGVFEELSRLDTLRPVLEHRRALLEKVAPVAQEWARHLTRREGVHGSTEAPGDIEAAWLWRQLSDELDRRNQESFEQLQAALDEKSTELRRITSELISLRAWAAQVRRTTLEHRQALFGWRDIVDRTPKTSRVPGKLARLRREAQAAMQRCRGAVPVWIMPLIRVVETFTVKGDRFDVAIIDEASQTDVMGLLVLYLAERVLVVGDHEQVSPAAVGQRQLEVRGLIDEHLQGIPNAILYEGTTSIYDLVRGSSGGSLCLVEHFRSVPEIIQFSNDLSYDGRIRPLRESSSGRIGPPLVPYRVESREVRGKVNNVEAEVVASLIVACTERPEYRDLSLGVVSLLGDQQGIAIEQLIRKHVPPDVYERHRLISGTAAQFQGDERDVMFLSLVDVPAGGPLRRRQQKLFQQRFNVAASRAKDQMWVVHSLEPGRDLVPGDLRRRLIEHAQDPSALMRKLDQVEKEAESEFERQVLRRLINAGYKVIPQYRAGYYFIDLVVVGGGKRLAIECDGDRYHPIEKIPEDMERQATLERCGWRFVRIRGSLFFRDPEAAMEPVFEALERADIPREGGEETQEPNESDSPLRSELVEEIIRRAAELRREWREEEAENGWGRERPTEDESRGGQSFGAQRDGDSRPGALAVEDNEREDTGRAESTSTGAGADVIAATESTQQNSVSDTTRSTGSRNRPDTTGRLKASEAPRRRMKRTPKAAEVQETSQAPEDKKAAGRTDAGNRGEDDHSSQLVNQDGRVWLGISHWAKVHEHFQGWERGILYTVGRNLRREWRLSTKQVSNANRLFEEAMNLGFDVETDVRDRAPTGDDSGAGRWTSIDKVPQEGIRKAILDNVPLSGEISREVLLQQAREQLGFDRLGPKIRRRLNRCIGGLVRADRLETNWQDVWRTEQLGLLEANAEEEDEDPADTLTN